MEEVRKATAQEAMESPHSLRPVIRQRHPASAVHLAFGAPRIRCSDLETRRIDYAVNFVLNPIDDYCGLGHAINAIPLGIHQLHIGLVEAGEILVVEGWAF